MHGIDNRLVVQPPVRNGICCAVLVEDRVHARNIAPVGIIAGKSTAIFLCRGAGGSGGDAGSFCSRKWSTPVSGFSTTKDRAGIAGCGPLLPLLNDQRRNVLSETHCRPDTSVTVATALGRLRKIREFCDSFLTTMGSD
jgi:hypothetical protein